MSKSKKQTLKDKPEKKAKASEDSSPKVAPKKFSEDDEDLEIAFEGMYGGNSENSKKKKESKTKKTLLVNL